MPSRRVQRLKRWEKSKALECAARYLVKEGRPLSAATVYDNMRFKDKRERDGGGIGKLYKNYRSAQSYGQIASRMRRCPAFKQTGKSPILFSCDKNTYERYWKIDPLGRGKYAK